MNRLKLFIAVLIASLSITVINTGSLSAYTVTTPEGVSYEVKDGCKDVGPRTSGFVDDNGCPISIEDYEKSRDDQAGPKPARIALFGGALMFMAAAVYFVLKKKSSQPSK